MIFPGFKKIQVSDGGDDEENFLISLAVFGFHLEHDIMSTIDRVKPVMKAAFNIRQYFDFRLRDKGVACPSRGQKGIRSGIVE